MTQPEGPAWGAAPQAPTPQPWPPEHPAPPWAGQPAPPQWPTAQGYAPWAPPPVPRRDSTRTMAIIALVTSGLALGGLVLSSIVPLLFFGLFAAVGGEALDEGSFPSLGTSYGGEVAPAADGSVAGPALAAAVTRLVQDDGTVEPGTRLSCDPVPRVAGGVSVLCRADDPAWFGIVRFTSTDGSFQVVTVSPDGELLD